MSIRFDFNGCLDTIVGAEHGLSLAGLAAHAARARVIHAGLQTRRRSGELGFFDVPETQLAPAAEIAAWATEVAPRFDAFVHIGIGGSGLGPICVQSALNSPYYNETAALRRGPGGTTLPRLYIVDNVDPEMLAQIDAVIDPARTLFHVVSKSGTTPETMTAFMYYLDRVVATGGEAAIARQFVFTTDPERGELRKLAARHGVRCFDIPPNVGGRFSVLTPVGLVPAALTGVDIEAMLAGAAAMQERCSTDDLMANPAYLDGLIHYLMDTERGKNIAVMMAYSQGLRHLAAWFAQLWAESLGKAHNVRGEAVHVGQTPVSALGATDQHSQVQLYAEGPNDKLFTFVKVGAFRADPMIPAAQAGLEAMGHFGGAPFARLLNTELDATAFALAAQKRPSVTLHVDTIDAATIGGLFQFFELQTAFAGGLYEIDAFDQPGVEEGKRATHALMGRGKPEDKAKLAEVTAFRAKLTQPFI